MGSLFILLIDRPIDYMSDIYIYRGEKFDHYYCRHQAITN